MLAYQHEWRARCDLSFLVVMACHYLGQATHYLIASCPTVGHDIGNPVITGVNLVVCFRYVVITPASFDIGYQLDS
jgi:hypothetical protein